ncbi:MAG: Phosphoenolpyruvate synthase/pyruvate phosphate dikinase [Candidatus Magasanikbacteria bacterium GW2011_GWC2_37_14]|uniref:Phosphoenolpyruvate synthase/pyruvate phosphate dikinase n=1 Tax=Candidatus Magasanikbacteria bacterium GW2011_GWC2_37_14 TaxID=1619046 RepID=A0A0G0GDY1_9BACT|nr:MAG: Phosphoenolpyruvate synthase/pyruvate phosphate dikinase [Candidatus Magasanikbacteria bacterium GW2011_GWC2_37_14]
MIKQYCIVNTEPNCNILGLHPIIRGFFHKDLERLTGRILKTFVYQVEGEVMNAIAEKESWFDFGDYLWQKINNDHQFAEQVKDHLLKNGQSLYLLCNETLGEFKSGQMTEEKIKESILKILELFSTICTSGMVGPFVELGGGGMSNKIAEIIRNKNLSVVEMSANECLSILTTPRNTTWTEDLKVELYLIADWLFEQGEKLDNLSDDGKKIILQAIEKYGWVFYGYKGPEYNINNAKEEISHILSQNLKPSEQLKIIKNNFQELLQKQTKIMEQLGFSEDEKYFVTIAQDFGYTKAYRANLMALACFTINKLLAVFAKKESYSIRQFGMCAVSELQAYLKNELPLPKADILNQRLNYALLISEKDSDKILVGEEAKQWMKDNVEVEEVDLELTEFAGTVACGGGVKQVQGIVKIVMSNQDINKVEAGDILLSSNTTPDHVPAMRRSAAIVTQTGGLTCHAAIVSRELNKPCLIGVKHLLQVFKDGDRVEVDLEAGIVRKLSC